MRATTLLLVTMLLAPLGAGAQQRSGLATMPRLTQAHHGQAAAASRHKDAMARYKIGETKAYEYALWRPVTETIADYEGGDWSDYAVYAYTYDNVGTCTSKTIQMAKFHERHTYTYYPNGLLKSELWEQANVDAKGNVGTFVPVERDEYAYDDYVYDRVVRFVRSEPDGNGQWQEVAGSYYHVIDRDAKGNIVQSVYMQKQANDEDYVPAEKVVYTYAEGVPVDYMLYSYDKGAQEWEEYQHFYDLRWERNDGQMFYDFQSFFFDNNKLLSATLDNRIHGDVDFYYNCTYGDNGYDFSLVIDVPATDIYEAMQYVSSYTILDDNGSYSGDDYTYDDMDYDGTFTEDELLEQYRSIGVYDEYGYEVHNEDWQYAYGEDDELWQYAGQDIDNVYSAYGYRMLTTIYDFQPEYHDGHWTGSYEPSMRITPHVIDIVSGTDGLRRPQLTDGRATRYYDLSGRQIAAPAGPATRGVPAGVYISEGGRKVLMR